ncbi:MAG: anti-sigma factor family protein [Polyangia bacterium]
MLERVSVDDLPPAQADEIRAHVASCASCAALLDELKGERAALVSSHPPAEFAATVGRRARLTVWRARRRWLGGATAALAMAAALLLLVTRPPKPDTRMRGQGLTLYRQRDGKVSMLSARDKVRAGDRLRVVLLLPRASTIEARFAGEHGQIENLLLQPLTLEAGEHALPDAFTVDAPCESGWLIVSRERLPDATALQTVLGFGKEATIEDALPGAHVRWLQCE